MLHHDAEIIKQYIVSQYAELVSKKLIELSIKAGLKHFIYASSGSVYGIKNEEKVTEDLELVPISAYNKTKMICERLLLSYKDKIDVYIVRPATVYGLSPRMRFDLTVNEFTKDLVLGKELIIFGEQFWRPYCHVLDFARNGGAWRPPE